MLLVPAAPLLAPGGVRHPVGRGAIALLALLSVGIQILGALPNYLDWYYAVNEYTLVYTSWAHTPLLGHLQAVLSGKLELLWEKSEIYFPGRAGQFAVLRGVVYALAAASGLRLWRAICAPGPMADLPQQR